MSDAQHLPLHDIHAARGAQFSDENGWTVPAAYGDVHAEYTAVRDGAGVVDLSDRGTIAVTGPDRTEFLQGQLTNEVKNLQPGQGCYSMICNLKGQIIADFGVLALDDAYLFDTPPGRGETVRASLDKFCIMEQVEFEDVTDRYGRIGVFGPKAKDAVGAVSDGGAPCTLEPCHHMEWITQTAGGEVMTRLVGPPDGTEGYYIFVARDKTASVWKALVDKGAASGFLPCGRDALAMIQIEEARPQYGREMDESTNAIEVKMYPAISYTKGCFTGQEAIARMTYRGRPAKQMQGLVIDGDVVPQPGDALVATKEDGSDKDAGEIRSAVFSPALNKPVALALVRKAFLEPGTAIRVKHNGEELAATVHALPFVGEPRPEGPDAAPKV